MIGEHIDGESRIHVTGMLGAQRDQLLIDEVAEHEPLVAERVVQHAGELRGVGSLSRGRTPQLGEQNLQGRRHRRIRVGDQVVGDRFRQPGLDAEPVVLSQAPGSGQPIDHVHHRLPVEAFEKHFAVTKIAAFQLLLDLRQPLLTKCQHQPPLGTGLLIGIK